MAAQPDDGDMAMTVVSEGHQPRSYTISGMRHARELLRYNTAQDILICTGHNPPCAVRSVYHHIRKAHSKEMRIAEAAVCLFEDIGRAMKGPLPNRLPITELGEPFAALCCRHCGHVVERDVDMKSHMRTEHGSRDAVPGVPVMAQRVSIAKKRVLFTVIPARPRRQQAAEHNMEAAMTRFADFGRKVVRQEPAQLHLRARQHPNSRRRAMDDWLQSLASMRSCIPVTSTSLHSQSRAPIPVA